VSPFGDSLAIYARAVQKSGPLLQKSGPLLLERIVYCEMGKSAKQQWRELHVWEFLSVLELHPPIGKGSKDTLMKEGGAAVVIWEPIAEDMNSKLATVNKPIIDKSPSDEGKLKSSVDAKECKSKYDSMSKQFKSTKWYILWTC